MLTTKLEEQILIQTGYQCQYGFGLRLLNAEMSLANSAETDANRIKELAKSLFESAKDDYKKLTELVLVLNWKIWYWYEKDENIARVYNDIWTEMDEWCCNNLTEEAAEYYYRTTD